MDKVKIKITPRMMRFRAAGLLVVVLSTAAASLWSDQVPWLAAISSGVCWYVGKLLGKPIEDVVAAALAVMQTDRAVAVTVQAIQSMPPDTARAVLSSIPPEAAGRAAAAAAVVLVPDPDSPPSENPPSRT